MSTQKQDLPYSPFDRERILAVLLDNRANWRTYHTADKITHRTGLDIREIMAVTGNYPYDIIGTRRGYKHITRASQAEIVEAIDYNRGKINAMKRRIMALAAQI